MNEILEKMADAFANIEKHDIRVGRVTLERDTYLRLATSRDTNFLNNYTNNPYRVIERTGAMNAIGMLWGAAVEIGDESRAYGEPGFIPKYLLPNNSEGEEYVTPNSEYSVGIFVDDTNITDNKLRRKLNQLRRNMTIIVKSRATFFGTIPPNEWKAIETLREMITEKEFRKYLRYGFVLVRGQSGAVYQVFRNKWHTKVWKNGKIVEEVCVRIKGCPPTDNVVAFLTMICADEDEFKKMGNVYKMAA